MSFSWQENEDWKEEGFLRADDLLGPHALCALLDSPWGPGLFPLSILFGISGPQAPGHVLSRVLMPPVLLVPQVQREFLAEPCPAESH